MKIKKITMVRWQKVYDFDFVKINENTAAIQFSNLLFFC